MIFRKRERGGKHRADPKSKRNLPVEVEVQSPIVEEDQAHHSPVSSQLPFGGPQAKEVDYVTPRSSSAVALPSLPHLKTEDEIGEVPKDQAARKAYLLLLEAEASDEVFDEVAELLEKRSSYLERLGSLNSQIERLVEDSHAREVALDELKLEAHLKELSSEEDESELVYDSWDRNPSYARNRDQLDTAVRLLVRLESSRALLLREYRPLMESILAVLPSGLSPALEAELKETFHADLQVFEEVHGHVIADGEHLGESDESLANIEEFLTELEKHSTGPMNSASGDSVFHLDK